MRTILPKTWVPELWMNGREGWPLFFLAGPIRGGEDWQRRCAVLIKKFLPESILAIPCRYNRADDPLFVEKLDGIDTRFERQTDWERYYLDLASRHGIGSIIFWLPCESETQPRDDGQPYACDTYGELGEWRGQLLCHRGCHNVVVGAEEGFPGLSVIERNFEVALPGSGFVIHRTLEATVAAGIKLATTQS